MRVYGKEHVAGDQTNGEGLALYLAPLNAPAIRERIGKENLHTQQGPFMYTLGQRYPDGDGHYVQGGRLLYVGDTQIVGAINFTKRGTLMVISNIYVDRHHRRQGVATSLVNKLRDIYKNVLVDGSQTIAGKAFFDTIP